MGKVMQDFAKTILESVRQTQDDLNQVLKPDVEGEKPKTNHVVDFILVKDTRGYIEKIVNQINGSYEHGWYDACAVMLRRFIETLIIEVFEHHKLESKIKNSAGDYVYLKDLINFMLTESTWSLGRNAKHALPKLKDIGDQSAHSRRFNANRNDIEKLLPEIRTVVQELVYLAKLK
jgi:Domain of unknown function (DUF4145)